MKDISSINLNLLIILDALLTCSHVSAAGRRVGLSQSGTSTALKQLRDLLQDPILVRGQGSQMYLTDYAKSIQGQVSQCIEQINKVFNREEFDPSRSARVFHVGMSDYLGFILLPKLINTLNQEAPAVKLIVHHMNYFNDPNNIESGQVDLILGNFPEVPVQIQREALYEDEGVFVAYKTHPIFKLNKKIDLKDIVSYPLIMVSFMNDPTDNYLDNLLKSEGYDTSVSVVVPHALTALYSLQKTQYITHTVRKIAEPIAKQIGLEFIPTPKSLSKYKKDPYIAHQYWTKAADSDPANQWLRSLIRQCCKTI